jgi:predicted N-acetyltransferase YhbS
LNLLPLSNCDAAAIEELLDAAFGADRRQRTAYKLRQGVDFLPALSFGLTDAGILVGSIQCWPVTLQENSFPLILVGPVAVSPTHQNQGLGHMLMHAMLDAAAVRSDAVMMMIGDPEYYERFGFSAGAAAGWKLPGPWEPRRLLIRNVNGTLLPQSGMIEPDLSYAL